MKNTRIKQRAIQLIPIIGCIIFIFLSCDLIMDTKSNGMIWYNEDLADFVIYAFAPGYRTLAMIELESGTVHHPVPEIESIQSVVTNKDGTKLYVSTAEGHAGVNPGMVYEINTSNWESRVIYENSVHLLSNRTGGIYFITKLDSGTKRIFGTIDPINGSVSELGTINVTWGAEYDDRLIEIHPYQPLVYAVDDWPGRLYRYNYVTQKKDYIFPQLSFASFARITLSGGGDSLYIPGGPVLDLIREEIVGSIPVWRLGWAASRRDNKAVYITDPGGYLRDPYPSGKVFIYSPERDRIIGYITVKKESGRTTDRIYLTPKERYAIVSDWGFFFYVIDLKSRKVVDIHEYLVDGKRTHSLQNFYLSTRPPGL